MIEIGSYWKSRISNKVIMILDSALKRNDLRDSDAFLVKGVDSESTRVVTIDILLYYYIKLSSLEVELL